MGYGDVTEFSSIYDIFMKLVDDYKLLDLYKTSKDIFEKYVEAWLILAINDFTPICTQDLNNVDMIRGQFNFVMNIENIAMLAYIMQKYWMMNTVQNTLQMTNVVQDKDFTRHSESQNIDTKENVLNDIIERTSQRLMEYKVKYFDWKTFSQQLVS